MHKNKLLLTGGCGFIGSNLVKKLEQKNYDVIILDNLSKGSLDYIKDCKARFIEADIRDQKTVAEAMQGVYGVIHLAAFGSVVESVESPEENFDINVRGTFNILNQCRKAGVQQVIFASTGGALIGNTPPPVNENSLPQPISPYGSGKLCGEAYCCSFAHAYDMNITALRFANVIGPVSWHKKGAVTAFMKSILNNQKITIYGDGTATRDFLFIDDLCNGIIQAYEKNLPGFTPVHLASGKEVSVRSLAQSICEVAGVSNYPIELLPRRPGEVEKNFGDYSLARQLFDFQPSTSLKEALSITWEWFKDQNRIIQKNKEN